MNVSLVSGPNVFLVWYEIRNNEDLLSGMQLDSIWTNREDAQRRINDMIKGGFPFPLKTEWPLYTKYEEDEDVAV